MFEVKEIWKLRKELQGNSFKRLVIRCHVFGRESFPLVSFLTEKKVIVSQLFIEVQRVERRDACTMSLLNVIFKLCKHETDASLVKSSQAKPWIKSNVLERKKTACGENMFRSIRSIVIHANLCFYHWNVSTVEGSECNLIHHFKNPCQSSHGRSFNVILNRSPLSIEKCAAKTFSKKEWKKISCNWN